MASTLLGSQGTSKSNGEYLDLEPKRVIGSGSFGMLKYCLTPPI